MAVLIAAAGLHLIARRRKIARATRLIGDTFRGRPADAGYEEAADALSSCPGPLRARFAVAWVWLPLGIGIVAALLACSAAYYVVDATLARFDVGLGQVLYGVGLALGSLVTYLAIARRLLTWRVAFAASRDAARH
jgi:hypothetical protein